MTISAIAFWLKEFAVTKASIPIYGEL